MGYIEELRAVVGTRPLILVGSVAVVENEAGHVLLEQRNSPVDTWGLPGGLMELGESVEDTARREVYEETGLRLGTLELIGVFSGPGYFVQAPNGDEFYVVTIAFHTRDFTGDLHVDTSESVTARFFPYEDMPLQMVGSHRKIIEAYLEKVSTDQA